MESLIGRYVVSKAGRDAGRLFIITAILDENHVMLADGELRRVDNPKKKKLRHLEILEKTEEQIAALIISRRRLLDSDLRNAIKSVVPAGFLE